MKNTLILFTILNIIYFIVTASMNQNNIVVNFFLLPFGFPAVIAFMLFFASIVSLIDENRRGQSLLLIILNGILLLLPILVIVLI
ncbi:hypothetical protein [Salinicoccus halodurans]|uniref:Uncharacterized protein n=1 Tax=Salinicoccus halodurans TaxID=407035 RepID=A0A0F7D4Q9_9STAP|nr:hypothetical protein [Salinicoccus halodurans]AKG74665.1 hypothetical protein AAT16_10960 [Salinicoccus halodurans]SFK88704.1 hypothetical protein SAMN05216235_2259 [Salinicoccus halodurans]